MATGICSNGTKGTARERERFLLFTGLLMASWVFAGPLARAEVLYQKDGVQLRGTARIITYNAAVCRVREENHTEAEYEAIKGNDGQPLHVWQLDYSAHNGTGKALSYLRADFEIESEHPPCTNWTGEGPGGGVAGGPYSDLVFWGGHTKTLSAPSGMYPRETLQGVLYLAVFHTDRSSFERWSTHFTFGQPDKAAPSRNPGAPSETAGATREPVPPSGGPGPSAAGQLPPEMMLDEYLLEVEMLVGEKDHQGALRAMDRILALRKKHGLDLPEEFPFLYAQSALAAGSYQAAIDAATQYVTKVGRGGKHYREALALRVKSRRGLREPAVTGAGSAAVTPDAARRGAPGADAAGRQRVQPQARERLPFEPEMVVIPGGSFRMGCVSGQNCDEDEHPVHTVRVESFELSKYEVTFEEYDRFTAATGRNPAGDSGWGRGRRPVIRVSWEDAVAYVRWLSGQTGERYRLPSEAEWEYAARAGSVTAYSWGNEIGRNRANCDGCGSQWDNRQTAPVGSFGPNGWGLHDMHGNVWEWAQDCWNDSYRGAPSDGSAWERGECPRRVLRGGSWYFNPGALRSALRGRGPSSVRNREVGFPVARTVTP